MSEIIRSSAAPRIVIDHHVSSDQLDAHEFKDVTAAATGELIFELAVALGITFDSTTANWLYAAIATDTGWFRFPSTTPRTMKIASALMEMGAMPHMVYGLVHEQLSLSRLRLGGRALARTVSDADGRLIS
jgi:phosphoesterase RecJ-like protein